jgi:hypothetical protein
MKEDTEFMSLRRPDIYVTEIGRSGIMTTEYISVTEALKLVSPFSGNKREVLTFVSNVDTTFGSIDPENRNRLYQVLLAKTSGKPRIAISHRNLENWEGLKNF